MQHGRIVETGTHKQLLEKQGYYARLCQSHGEDTLAQEVA